MEWQKNCVADLISFLSMMLLELLRLSSEIQNFPNCLRIK
jgi:hypothetical protein